MKCVNNFQSVFSWITFTQMIRENFRQCFLRFSWVLKRFPGRVPAATFLCFEFAIKKFRKDIIQPLFCHYFFCPQRKICLRLSDIRFSRNLHTAFIASWTILKRQDAKCLVIRKIASHLRNFRLLVLNPLPS